MREGKASIRFGARGLNNIHLGGGDTPLLLKLYDANDNVLATLTEEKGECIDPGYVDFFLGPNCRPAQYQKYLIEKLPDGTTGVLHDNPTVLARDMSAWVAFLDKWVSKHELSQKKNQPGYDVDSSKNADMTNLRSRIDAEAIAVERGPFDYVDLKVDQALVGKVMGVTDAHVVLSLGRSAAIITQSNLSRVPAMGEIATITIKDGKGMVADVLEKSVGKGL